MKKALLCIVYLVILCSFQMPETSRIHIYLAGDSTMSVKQKKAWPETGWGMPFSTFWDSAVVVDNRAMNGRSTKTFILEGRWQSIAEALVPGDYVFIQFGHNDESVEKKERYTPPDSFQLNLRRFVTEARARKALPVLFTPVSRRKFDKSGQALETHSVYTPLVKAVAADMKVPLIDLDARSRALYQELGDAGSRLLFLQLKPGEHPNYPQGKEDNTHFNELGARLIAQLVLADIRKTLPELADHIIKTE